jgi:hypothetical protein
VLREQRMMNRMVEELGDELDEYIANFNGCDFWRFKEGELIVNKTFKRLLGIIADFNLTTADIILETAEGILPESKNEMEFILTRLADQYINIGGDSILNRTMVFCFILHHITQIDENFNTATKILEHSANSEIMYKKESLWQKIKFYIGLEQLPYKVRANTRAIGLMSLLAGKSGNEMTKDVGIYYEII